MNNVFPLSVFKMHEMCPVALFPLQLELDGDQIVVPRPLQLCLGAVLVPRLMSLFPGLWLLPCSLSQQDSPS